MRTYDLGDARVLELAPSGPVVSTEQDAVDLVGELLGRGADTLVVPVTRLPAAFFQLRTGLLGAFVQKLTNYRVRAVFLGDLTEPLAASEALRAFVRESDRSAGVLFVADRGELERRLRA